MNTSLHEFLLSIPGVTSLHLSYQIKVEALVFNLPVEKSDLLWGYCEFDVYEYFVGTSQDRKLADLWDDLGPEDVPREALLHDNRYLGEMWAVWLWILQKYLASPV